MTTTTTTKKKSNLSRSSSAVKDRQIAITTMPNINGQSRRTRKDNSMKPENFAAQHLLQLRIKNLNNEEEEVKYPRRSHHMHYIDKLKLRGGKEDRHEESNSDASYITDDSSVMETTMAAINAADQIMQLSSSYSKQQAAEEEEEEETTRYYNSTDDSSGMVSSKRKDFEEIYAFLPRKHKFRSLADLYEVTQPLEDSHFD